MIFPEGSKNKFRNFVTSRCGLYFKDHDLGSLEDAIVERTKACGFDSVERYYTYLTYSSEKETEFRELLNLLTIKHTYFFRNEPQFKVLRERVLPEIIERKKRAPAALKPALRIWSAGCSTGEEPYSIAMAVADVIKDLDEWSVQIIATDASTSALEKSKAGIYGKSPIMLVDERHKKKYFIEQPGPGGRPQYAVCDTIKKMVHFSYLNLMDKKLPGGFDIIFCRNVVIYFELETTIKLMDRFHSSLADDGYLFIGYSESLQFISDKFRMENWKESVFYRKSREAAVPGGGVPSPAAGTVEEVIEEISKAELEAEKKVELKRHVTPPERIESLLVQIMKAFHLKRYDEALSLIDKAQAIDNSAVDTYYLAAEIYANQGKLDTAKERLQAVLELNELFTPAYYLFGSIYTEEGNLEKAEKNLKKALYLDADFALAYFSLATVYRKEGRVNEALRGYRNTLNVLLKDVPDAIIAYSGGFNSGTLISMCKNNIERLKKRIE